MTFQVLNHNLVPRVSILDNETLETRLPQPLISHAMERNESADLLNIFFYFTPAQPFGYQCETAQQEWSRFVALARKPGSTVILPCAVITLCPSTKRQQKLFAERRFSLLELLQLEKVKVKAR